MWQCPHDKNSIRVDNAKRNLNVECITTGKNISSKSIAGIPINILAIDIAFQIILPLNYVSYKNLLTNLLKGPLNL